MKPRAVQACVISVQNYERNHQLILRAKISQQICILFDHFSSFNDNRVGFYGRNTSQFSDIVFPICAPSFFAFSDDLYTEIRFHRRTS